MSDDAGQEPSMEEILASIRKIISEDGEETEEEKETQAVPEPEPEPEEDDVLELVDEVEPEPAPVAELEEITLVDEVIDEKTEGLISAATTAAGATAFAQLAGAMEPKMPLGGVDRTLESLVKEVMRPLLRDWLDANLPAVVERLVQQEIKKMSAKPDDG